MGEVAYDKYDEAKAIFHTGSEILGEDLAEICFGSQTEKLDSSLVQPAIVAAELVNYYDLKQRGVSPQLLMGHSLGELTALRASGSVSTEDIFKIVKVRAEVTQRSNENNPGGMAAIVGLSGEQASRVIDSANHYFHRLGNTAAGYLANNNWRLEQVLSGHEDAIDRVKRIVGWLKALNLIDRAAVIKLKVPGAFHSPHNSDGVEEYKEAIARVDKKFPNIMLLNNQGRYMIDPHEFADYYSRQLVMGVEWNLMMHRAVSDGVRDFKEVTLSDEPKKATLTNFFIKEFACHEIVATKFGEIIRIKWVPQDSEYMQDKIDAVTSLQEA